MNTAILAAQIVGVILQACFVLLAILLLAASIQRTQDEERQAHDAMEQALALVQETRHEPLTDAELDDWAGKWPPWDENDGDRP